MKEYFFLVITGQVNGFIPDVLKFLLKLCAGGYGLGLCVVGLAYRTGFLKTQNLRRPVISVGNITWGGVGKTPLIVYLIKICRNAGKQPVVLMRGYMPYTTSGDNGEPESDEAQMLKESSAVPVVVGKDRVQAARRFLQDYSADVFLLDDGFQQWGVERDLNIVVIDASNPFGNGFLIPRGSLREPLEVLSRADIFVLTRTDQAIQPLENLRRQLRQYQPEALIVETIHQPVALRRLDNRNAVGLDLLKHRPVCYFCAIGNPSSFEQTLITQGAQIRNKFVFLDHHPFSRDDIRRIVYACRIDGIDTIVTTAKDAVKCRPFLDLFGGDLVVLSLEIEIVFRTSQDAFSSRIRNLLQR